jgi:hypothetical protein
MQFKVRSRRIWGSLPVGPQRSNDWEPPELVLVGPTCRRSFGVRAPLAECPMTGSLPSVESGDKTVGPIKPQDPNPLAWSEPRSLPIVNGHLSATRPAGELRFYVECLGY